MHLTFLQFVSRFLRVIGVIRFTRRCDYLVIGKSGYKVNNVSVLNDRDKNYVWSLQFTVLVPVKAITLTCEAVRNGSLKKNPEKLGNGGEPNRDMNARDENKRTRTENAFAITTNPMRREYNGTIPKCVSCNLHHPPEMPCRACLNYGRPGLWHRTVEWLLGW
nr:hypothetical protein [Tanacetum cinerariifolium]